MSAVFNEMGMTRWSHNYNGFNNVLHVAHKEWHGIRNATANCPGHKLLVSSEHRLQEAHYNEILAFIEQHKINRIVLQGYSDNLDLLVLRLNALLGSSVPIYAITHVTTGQFDNYYELEMQARLLMRLRYKEITRLGSVKPNFHTAIEEYFPHTIFNFAPNFSDDNLANRTEQNQVYVPLDVGWRKNLFTNIIGALKAPNVSRVNTTNYPNGLESVVDLSKLKLINYLRGRKLFKMMADNTIVLLATFAECQPMTQLEAFSVGTIAITGPLRMQEFFDDELIRNCEVPILDNPLFVTETIEKVLAWYRADPGNVEGLIKDHLARRHNLAAERYADFLDL